MWLPHTPFKLFRRDLVEHQAGGAVGAGGELLVEHIEALGIATEQLHLGDHVAGIGLLLTLLLDEPVEELHGAEVLHLVGGVIDGVNRGGDILLMLQAGLQHIHVFLVFLVGLGDGIQYNGAVVVLHVLVDEHGMVALFLSLDHVPVGEAGEAALVEVVVHVKIKVAAVQLFIDLLVEQVGNFFVKHNKLVASICAAPHLVGRLGYLKDKNYTVHPGFEQMVVGGNYQRDKGVVRDGNFITAKSMYYSIEFGLAIHEYFHGHDSMEALRRSCMGEK